MADQKDLTAVDHVNNKMLHAFKAHLEKGKVPVYDEKQDENDDEWDDNDYTNESLPTKESQVLRSEENSKEEEKN